MRVMGFDLHAGTREHTHRALQPGVQCTALQSACHPGVMEAVRCFRPSNGWWRFIHITVKESLISQLSKCFTVHSVSIVLALLSFHYNLTDRGLDPGL